MNSNSQEIVELNDDVVDDIGFIARLNLRAKELQQFKISVIAQTEVTGWERFGEYFRLNDAGAKAIARPLGLVWYGEKGPGTPLTIVKEPQPDGSFAIIVTGFISKRDPVSGRVIFEIPCRGRCFSDNAFLARASKYHSRSPRDEEIIEKAIANFISRAVAAAVGLKQVTAEMLEEAREINQRLDYRKIRSAEFLPAKDTVDKKREREASIGLQRLDELKRVVREIATAEFKTEELVLEELSTYEKDGRTYKITDYESVTPRWLEVLLKKASARAHRIGEEQ